jgi:predicted ATPase/DNA-binding SARP family transcriptional activator
MEIARLSLYFFGSPRIELDGIPVSIDLRKAIALLAYLAMTRQEHSRDSLAALLWPDNDQSHARAALRRTLFTLNKTLIGDWLTNERDAIGLNLRADIWIDTHQFQNALTRCTTHGHAANEQCTACVEPLSEAVALYTDDFLAGFGLRDSPEFDEWQFYQADTLRREFATALERLVYCHSALRNFDAAIRYARRWLALDRLHEPAYRQLMLLNAWAGQRATALHQYRECVQVLDAELGVAPLEATTHLYHLIKENHVPPPPASLPAPISTREQASAKNDVSIQPTTAAKPASEPVQPPAPTTTGFPLVGRDKEWALLLKQYAAIDGGGQIIVIEGEAGIGKTRLANEFLAFARERGAVVLEATCYEGEANLAYGPVVTILRKAITQQQHPDLLQAIPAPLLSEATRLLPELTAMFPGLNPPPALDSPGAQQRFFEGIRQLLLVLSQGSAPGVLFFDDLQWADSASLDLLSYLMRRLHEQPLCLVFTWRGKQFARGTSLDALLVAGQRAGHITRVVLSRLDEAAVRELVQSLHAKTHMGDIVHRLYAETEGIPFFLAEYLNAIEQGVLRTEQDDWSLPGGVRDLLQSRLSAVDELGWQVLTTAAIIGRSFDFDTLREVSGRSEEETITALEQVTRQGLVEEEQYPGSVGSDRDSHLLMYDFSHEKLRTLVYEETSLARRRLLHRRIAEVLAGQSRGRRDIGPLAGQIARHYRLAGNDAAAADYFRQAGAYARRLYANTEALAHLQTALALGHPDTAGLHEDIGDLQTLLGEYSAALRSYETAAVLSAGENLARIEQKLGTVYVRRGEWDRAENHFEAALRASKGSERSTLYADWSLAAYRRGQTQKAIELAKRALSLAGASQDRQALAQAHNMLGMLASHQGDTEAARHHLEQSLALAEALDDPAMRAAALNNLAQAYRSGGDMERAMALTEAALALCISQGDRHHEAALHSNLADLLHAVGRSDEAMAHLKQAVSIYAEIGVEAGDVQPAIWKLAEW